MGASYPTKLLLAYRSGDVCALPACQCRLTPDSESEGPTNVGEAAHIEGEHDGKGRAKKSARFNPNMTDEERNHYSNLIYLCGVCHTKVDALPQGEIDYPVEKLKTIKKEHEKKVRKAIQEAFSDVGFAELHEATKWVAKISPSIRTFDFSLLKVDEKIKKNDLNNESHNTIVMGLSVANDVALFIETVAQTDPDFPERLKSGFLEEYFRNRKNGIKGPDLFEIMCRFSQQGFQKQSQRSAGLAVLVYLFEACEVFEK